MSLHAYIRTLDRDALEGFAKKCQTTVGQLKQVAYGNRRAGAGLAINLDRETGGQVTCEELRPDIDWAYLRQRTA